MYWMVWSMFLGNDFRKDLHLRNIYDTISRNSLTVLGAMENSGSRRWEDPVIKAEFLTDVLSFQ